MTKNLIEHARVIAADEYIRLEMKDPTPRHTLAEWAAHIQAYSGYILSGHYDSSREVQTAIAALRSAVL